MLLEGPVAWVVYYTWFCWNLNHVLVYLPTYLHTSLPACKVSPILTGIGKVSRKKPQKIMILNFFNPTDRINNYILKRLINVYTWHPYIFILGTPIFLYLAPPYIFILGTPIFLGFYQESLLTGWTMQRFIQANFWVSTKYTIYPKIQTDRKDNVGYTEIQIVSRISI